MFSFLRCGKNSSACQNFPLQLAPLGASSLLICFGKGQQERDTRLVPLICPLLRRSYQFPGSSSHLHGRGMSWGAPGGELQARAAPHAWI